MLINEAVLRHNVLQAVLWKSDLPINQKWLTCQTENTHSVEKGFPTNIIIICIFKIFDFFLIFKKWLSCQTENKHSAEEKDFPPTSSFAFYLWLTHRFPMMKTMMMIKTTTILMMITIRNLTTNDNTDESLVMMIKMRNVTTISS